MGSQARRGSYTALLTSALLELRAQQGEGPSVCVWAAWTTRKEDALGGLHREDK